MKNLFAKLVYTGLYANDGSSRQKVGLYATGVPYTGLEGSITSFELGEVASLRSAVEAVIWNNPMVFNHDGTLKEVWDETTLVVRHLKGTPIYVTDTMPGANDPTTTVIARDVKAVN